MLYMISLTIILKVLLMIIFNWLTKEKISLILYIYYFSPMLHSNNQICVKVKTSSVLILLYLLFSEFLWALNLSSNLCLASLATPPIFSSGCAWYNMLLCYFHSNPGRKLAHTHQQWRWKTCIEIKKAFNLGVLGKNQGRGWEKATLIMVTSIQTERRTPCGCMWS